MFKFDFDTYVEIKILKQRRTRESDSENIRSS